MESEKRYIRRVFEKLSVLVSWGSEELGDSLEGLGVEEDVVVVGVFDQDPLLGGSGERSK